MAQTGVESQLTNWPRRLFKLLVFAVISLVVSFMFEKFTTAKGLEEMRDYQVEAQVNLGKIQPLALYHYFISSFGSGDVKEWETQSAFQSSKADCQKSGDAAMADYIALHVNSVRSVQNADGSLGCLAAKKPDALQSADKSLDAIIVLGGMSECLEAYHAHENAFRQCVAAIPGPVSGWAAQYLSWIGNSEWTRVSYIKLGLSAITPALALVDVVWHNYLNLQPGALFIWLLLAFGFIASLWLLNVMKVGEEGVLGILLWLALLPAGTVAISSVLAVVFQAVGLTLMSWFGGFISGAGMVVAWTSSFMLLQFTYLTLLKVVEDAGHSSLHHWLQNMFSWLA